MAQLDGQPYLDPVYNVSLPLSQLSINQAKKQQFFCKRRILHSSRRLMYRDKGPRNNGHNFIKKNSHK